MSRIGIVGAGVAGAALAHLVDGAAPGVDLVVLERSGDVGGRGATRHRGDVTYDYGANYLKSDDDRVTELLTETLDADGLVDVTEPVWTFDADGDVSEGRDVDDHKWSYRSGITEIAKRLFAGTDATVHRDTRVETLRRDGDAWHLTDDAGRTWGPFDAVALTPPAPGTAELLEAADWDHPTREALAAAARAVDYRTIWTAVLHYPFGIDRPYYGLVNTDKAHDVGWISREECKPGHVPAGESLLIVQANHEWSVAHYDDPPAENVAALAAATADVVGDDRLTEPDWTDHRGWRYALPEAGVRRGPLADAETRGLYCAGDWVAGEARLHAALRSGLDVGERLVYAL